MTSTYILISQKQQKNKEDKRKQVERTYLDIKSGHEK